MSELDAADALLQTYVKDHEYPGVLVCVGFLMIGALDKISDEKNHKKQAKLAIGIIGDMALLIRDAFKGDAATFDKYANQLREASTEE